MTRKRQSVSGREMPRLNAEHIEPISGGGSTHPDNVVFVEANVNRGAIFVTEAKIVGRGMVNAADVLFVRRRRSQAHATAAAALKAKEPPAFAEWMVSCIVKKSARAGILGDMEERFRDNLDRMSPARARRLYWADAVQSVAPLIWQAIKRCWIIAIAWKAFGGH